jgi:uncharacterized membrane protein YdjX (TVP38/TMEM64 family)
LKNVEDISIKMKKFLNEKKVFGVSFKIIFTIISIALIFFIAKELIHDVNSISSISKAAGNLGPIVLIFLISLGILFTPIPSFILIITAGYLYGIWQGALYSYIGAIIAAIGTFTATNIFNIKLKNKRYEKYRKKIKEKKIILALLYIIPIVPISIVSVMAASSKIKLSKFLEIIFPSFIPLVLFFSFFGSRLNSQNLTEIGIFLGILITLIIIIFEIKYRIKKTSQKN